MNVPTTEQLDELDLFFKSVTIPEVIKLSGGAITQNDAPKFVKRNLAILKSNQLNPLIAATRFHALCEIRKAVTENTGEAKPDNSDADEKK